MFLINVIILICAINEECCVYFRLPPHYLDLDLIPPLRARSQKIEVPYLPVACIHDGTA